MAAVAWEAAETEHARSLRAGGEQTGEDIATPIQLLLGSGDRLRIPSDAATLKSVLAVLRETA